MAALLRLLELCASEGVKAWKQYMQPWKQKGAILVSPSVAQGTAGEGWLEEFLAKCPPHACDIDAIALHWYEGAHQIEYFKQYFTDAWNKPAYQKLPIYVNEFGPTSGTIEEKAAFVKLAVEWMDQQSFIVGYAVSPLPCVQQITLESTC